MFEIAPFSVSKKKFSLSCHEHCYAKATRFLSNFSLFLPTIRRVRVETIDFLERSRAWQIGIADRSLCSDQFHFPFLLSTSWSLQRTHMCDCTSESKIQRDKFWCHKIKVDCLGHISQKIKKYNINSSSLYQAAWQHQIGRINAHQCFVLRQTSSQQPSTDQVSFLSSLN